MKTLMFDLEHGSQTLGSKEHIHKQFGFPVLQPGTWNQFQATIGKLYTKKQVNETVKIGSLEIEEQREVVVPKNGTEIDALILDTFSELSKKYMRELSDKDGKMKLQGWGMLKNKLDGSLDFISKYLVLLSVTVIQRYKLWTMVIKLFHILMVVAKKISVNGLILYFTLKQ